MIREPLEPGSNTTSAYGVLVVVVVVVDILFRAQEKYRDLRL
jgi:hypothetical protein